MNTKYVLQIVILTGLIFLFNNCGKGFKSLDFNSQSSQGLPTPTVPPTATATPTPTPTIPPTPTPRPSPTPTPTCSCTPTPTPTIPPTATPNPDSLPTKPAWYDALPVGVWTAIGTNTTSSVRFSPDYTYPYNSTNTGFSSIMDAWSGGAFARRMGNSGTLLVYGGGHQDYWGNDVYGFDMESQTWRLVSQPYTGAINFPLAEGLFPDGTPGPFHSYNLLQYDPSENNFYIFGREYNNIGGYVYPYFSYLNLAQPRLTNRANWTNLSSSVRNSAGAENSSCYDQDTNTFWMFGSGRSLTKFDIATKTATSYINYKDDGYGSTADCAKGLYVYTSGGSSIRARDLSAPAQDSFTLASVSVSSDPGFSWSNRRQAFIHWINGAAVNEFRYLGGNARSPSAWTFQSLGITGSGAAIPQRNSNGTYGRFRVVEFKDGSEMAIVVNSVNGRVHVFKMP